MKKSIKPKNEDPIYRQYRVILKKQNLSCKEIDEMRLNLKILEETICEHVWKKKFY
jgi:hypothetical protein